MKKLMVNIKKINGEKRMERKNTLVNAIPGMPSIKIGSSLASIIFGLVVLFLFLYLFNVGTEDQKNLWLILMVAMIVIGVIVVALTAGRRTRYTRCTRRGYYTTAARRSAVREKVVVVKYCVKCGKEIPVKETFCEHCGTKQPSPRSKQVKECEECHKEIPVKAEYCTHCGAKQKD